jgi:hypothetical protein
MRRILTPEIRPGGNYTMTTKLYIDRSVYADRDFFIIFHCVIVFIKLSAQHAAQQRFLPRCAINPGWSPEKNAALRRHESATTTFSKKIYGV